MFIFPLTIRIPEFPNQTSTGTTSYFVGSINETSQILVIANKRSNFVQCRRMCIVILMTVLIMYMYSLKVEAQLQLTLHKQ